MTILPSKNSSSFCFGEGIQLQPKCPHQSDRNIQTASMVIFFSNILRFFPITLVFLNFLTGIMLQMSTKVVYDAEESKLNIEILHNTWLHHHLQKEPYTINHIAQIYFVTYYWITQTCLVTGFGDIVAKLPSGMYFVVLSIIAGYLMFTYVLVVISSSIANINSNLTTYQEYVRDLVSYMKREKLGTELQKQGLKNK